MVNSFHRLLLLGFVWALLLSFFSYSSLHGYQRRRAHLQIKKAGDLGQILIPVAAACVAAAHLDYRGIGNYASSFGTALGVSYIIKPAINAKRPNGGNMSFPSGHTAAAMVGASFLHMRYGLLYGLPAYIAASYVGFSRVYAYKHWFRDVLGATTIAMAANAFFTRPYDEGEHKFFFIPQIEPGRAGIMVCWEW